MFGKNIEEILKNSQNIQECYYLWVFLIGDKIRSRHLSTVAFHKNRNVVVDFWFIKSRNKIIELAYRVYVSIQTISNWKNNKNYPDINGNGLLSEVFEISIYNLIKGDLEKRKRKFTEKISHSWGFF